MAGEERHEAVVWEGVVGASAGSGLDRAMSGNLASAPEIVDARESPAELGRDRRVHVVAVAFGHDRIVGLGLGIASR